MMKKIFNYLPYVLIVLIQFLVNNYTAILVSIILLGVIASFRIKRKGVFLKSFLIALIVFTTVFLVYQSRVEYIKGLLVNLGLSGGFIYVFFPILNALNTAILFFFGYKIGTLFTKKKSTSNEQSLDAVV